MNRVHYLFHKLRKSGYRPLDAWRNARTWAAFEKLEDLGMVRIHSEPEQESYFDAYGLEEGYTDIHGRRVSAEEAQKQMEEAIERDGCWRVMAQVNRGTEDDPEWDTVDSIGFCAGYNDPEDPCDNWYVPDLMSAAIEAKACDDWRAKIAPRVAAQDANARKLLNDWISDVAARIADGDAGHCTEALVRSVNRLLRDLESGFYSHVDGDGAMHIQNFACPE